MYTQSGKLLGRIGDVEIDPATHEIAAYVVIAANLPLGGLWHKKLIIQKSQVVSLTEKKMVVHDTTDPLPASANVSLAADAS